MARTDGTTRRLTVETEEGRLVIEIVGGWPDSEPYIWIGEGTTYLDSLDTDAVRLLAQALADILEREGYIATCDPCQDGDHEDCDAGSTDVCACFDRGHYDDEATTHQDEDS